LLIGHPGNPRPTLVLPICSRPAAPSPGGIPSRAARGHAHPLNLARRSTPAHAHTLRSAPGESMPPHGHRKLVLRRQALLRRAPREIGDPPVRASLLFDPLFGQQKSRFWAWFKGYSFRVSGSLCGWEGRRPPRGPEGRRGFSRGRQPTVPKPQAQGALKGRKRRRSAGVSYALSGLWRGGGSLPGAPLRSAPGYTLAGPSALRPSDSRAPRGTPQQCYLNLNHPRFCKKTSRRRPGFLLAGLPTHGRHFCCGSVVPPLPMATRTRVAMPPAQDNGK
jgi:hypothetical protein